jgi:hypothetical protein
MRLDAIHIVRELFPACVCPPAKVVTFRLISRARVSLVVPQAINSAGTYCIYLMTQFAVEERKRGAASRMSEESNRMLALLQELALIKSAGDTRDTAARRKEISNEMKQLAEEKQNGAA